MAEVGWQVVGADYRELQLGRTIGDAVRLLVKARFKNHSAKQIEAKWGLDPRTARNVVSQGNVSERTLTKAARSEGWAFWMALGEELFGQSYAAWEEDRLTKILEETSRDLERVRRLRPALEALHERSAARVEADLLEGHGGAQSATGGEGHSRGRPARRRASGAGQ